jgi:hypothetical protein
MADLSELAALRDWITEHLASSDDFRGVKVLSRKVGNLQNQIERELGKTKIVAVVLIPSAKSNARQSQRPILDPVQIIVRIAEDPLLNKTGKSSAYLAERAMALLQFRKPTVPGADLIHPHDDTLRQLAIIPAKPDEEEAEDFDGWDARFHTKLALQPAS